MPSAPDRLRQCAHAPDSCRFFEIIRARAAYCSMSTRPGSRERRHHMSLPIQVALIPDGAGVRMSELSRVAAALSKQVLQDFGPIWGIQAVVTAYARLEDMPLGAWPIIITTQDLGDASGFHTNRHGHPLALVQLESEWSISASHECLEKLADPTG